MLLFALHKRAIKLQIHMNTVMIGISTKDFMNTIKLERILIMEKITGYIGTYASQDSKGIYHFVYDTNKQAFDDITLFYRADDAKYLSLQDHVLAAPCKAENAGICMIDETYKEPVSTLFMEDTTACYVIQDGKFLYTANYHEGTVMVYKNVHHQLQFHHKITIALHAGSHQVIVYRNYILVPCLLLDKIAIYDTTANYAHVRDIWFEKGCGPRHGVFNKAQDTLYVVSELSNEVFVYAVNALTFTLKHRIHLVSQEGKAASAAIRLSADENFLYVSIRDKNCICVIDTQKMDIIQSVDSGGDHPRDMNISPDGNYIFVVNRFSNQLVVFSRDQSNGKINKQLAQTSLVEGVSIVFQEGGKANEK